MSATEFSRFDDLVSRYLDDALTDNQAAELVALLAESPLATRFLETTRLNSEIAGLLAAPVPDAAMVELVRTDIKKIVAGESAVGGVFSRVLSQAQPPISVPPIFSSARPKAARTQPVSRALAGAAVFIVFAGLSAIFFLNRIRAASTPTVASSAGEVLLVGPAGEHVLAPNQSWPREHQLTTVGPNSKVTVTFSDGSQLDFDGDTVAVNESHKGGRRIALERGSVQATIKKQIAERPFIFATPQAEIVVVGTTLRLTVENHTARLEVTEGIVRFFRHHGDEVIVRTGEYALVAPNVPLVATPILRNPHHIQ